MIVACSVIEKDLHHFVFLGTVRGFDKRIRIAGAIFEEFFDGFRIAFSDGVKKLLLRLLRIVSHGREGREILGRLVRERRCENGRLKTSLVGGRGEKEKKRWPPKRV